MQSLLFIASTLFCVAAYVYYFKDIKNDSIKPNRWSWLIWSFAILIETLTYNEVSGDIVKSSLFFVSTASCIVITVLLWKKSIWQKPDKTELFCVLVSVVALVIWQKYHLTKWAHFIMVGFLPIAFVPTYRNAFVNFKKEDTPAWMLWTFGDLSALLLVFIRLDKMEELPYAVVEFLCHLAVWSVISVRRRATP